MPTYLRLDLFPATAVVAEGAIYTPARVIVSEDTVYVYMDADNGPVERYSARLADFTGDKSAGYTATTDDGESVHISRAQHCGCGSRLRGFRPFPGVPITSRVS